MFDDCEKTVHIHLCSNKSEAVHIQISNSVNLFCQRSDYRNLDSHFSKRFYACWEKESKTKNKQYCFQKSQYFKSYLAKC